MMPPPEEAPGGMPPRGSSGRIEARGGAARAGEPVRVLDTGSCNLASVMAALRRIGAGAVPCADAAAVRTAERLVLPGVGAFGSVMGRIRDLDLEGALIERIEARHPTLAICLGLQVLCEGSEESPAVAGLGILPGRAARFDPASRVPQLGWNRIDAGGCRLLSSGHAYFAHSYRLTDPPAGWAAATAEYGGSFVAAIEDGGVLACQFHPEVSGAWGRALIVRWLSSAGRSAC
jgi:imidazole glycerol phosphate synthase glutamine amidotransferase subunit